MVDKYNLTADHESWYDAVRGDRDLEEWSTLREARLDSATPWEIKGAVRRRTDGGEGRIRIFEEPHEKLEAVGGWYAIAAYRVRGRGIEILDSTAIKAADLALEWKRSGHDRDKGRECQARVTEFFG
jgi:hypothetical protein